MASLVRRSLSTVAAVKPALVGLGSKTDQKVQQAVVRKINSLLPVHFFKQKVYHITFSIEDLDAKHLEKLNLTKHKLLNIWITYPLSERQRFQMLMNAVPQDKKHLFKYWMFRERL